MQIVFLVKPYTVNMYSYANDAYELLGSQDITIIENESNSDYENRMIYVCKDICQDFVNHDLYKKTKKEIKNIKVILTNPWCIYEVMNLEKDFEKSEKMDQRLIDKMMIHKDSDDMTILKNSIFNVSLNGYNVTEIHGQQASKVHLQYISIYSSKNFLIKLTNTLETIFHLHKIEIDSIYSHINENHKDDTTENQLKIIIEDQGIDLSYVHQNKNIASFFNSFGGFLIKDKIKQSLHIDNNILDKILRSKASNLYSDRPSFIHDKTLDNIWLDLDENVKTKINEITEEEFGQIKTQIRTFIDNIENEYIAKDVNINIYCLDEYSLNTTGLILAHSLKEDAYILGKLLTNESLIFTKKIF